MTRLDMAVVIGLTIVCIIGTIGVIILGVYHPNNAAAPAAVPIVALVAAVLYAMGRSDA